MTQVVLRGLSIVLAVSLLAGAGLCIYLFVDSGLPFNPTALGSILIPALAVLSNANLLLVLRRPDRFHRPWLHSVRIAFIGGALATLTIFVLSQDSDFLPLQKQEGRWFWEFSAREFATATTLYLMVALPLLYFLRRFLIAWRKDEIPAAPAPDTSESRPLALAALRAPTSRGTIAASLFWILFLSFVAVDYGAFRNPGSFDWFGFIAFLIVPVTALVLVDKLFARQQA